MGLPKAARTEGNHAGRGAERGEGGGAVGRGVGDRRRCARWTRETRRAADRDAARGGDADGADGMELTLIHPVTAAGQDAGDVARGGCGTRGALLTRETLRAADAGDAARGGRG